MKFTYSPLCEICGKPRNTAIHVPCSKSKQKLGGKRERTNLNPLSAHRTERMAKHFRLC